ncbi:hypothetical protein KDK88_04015 [bacterium]|nr:hypothetical protein [bacterium]
MGLGLALTAGAGCIFTPRDPEAPGQSVEYVNDSDPGNVVYNLEQALLNLDPAGYQTRLSEDFRYEPDSGTLANYPGVDWANWGYEQEVAFIQDFLGNVDGVNPNLNLELIEGDDSGAGTEAFVRYISAVTVESGGGEIKYRATVTMEFKIDGTFWRLSRWFDEQGETDPDTGALLPTLGQRRGAFAASGGG